MNGNQNVELRRLVEYLTHFPENVSLPQNFTVCLADRSTTSKIPSKLPARAGAYRSHTSGIPSMGSSTQSTSRMPTAQPRGTSRLPTSRGTTGPYRIPTSSSAQPDGLLRPTSTVPSHQSLLRRPTTSGVRANRPSSISSTRGSTVQVTNTGTIPKTDNYSKSTLKTNRKKGNSVTEQLNAIYGPAPLETYRPLEGEGHRYQTPSRGPGSSSRHVPTSVSPPSQSRFSKEANDRIRAIENELYENIENEFTYIFDLLDATVDTGNSQQQTHPGAESTSRRASENELYENVPNGFSSHTGIPPTAVGERFTSIRSPSELDPQICRPPNFERVKDHWKKNHERKRAAIRKRNQSRLNPLTEEPLLEEPVIGNAISDNEELSESQILAALEFQERRMRQQFEEENFPTGLIFDTDRDILVSSSEESFEADLVVRGPSIEDMRLREEASRAALLEVNAELATIAARRKAKEEALAAEARLPLPRQAIPAGNRLSKLSIKDKHCIDVARNKYYQSQRRRNLLPPPPPPPPPEPAEVLMDSDDEQEAAPSIHETTVREEQFSQIPAPQTADHDVVEPPPPITDPLEQQEQQLLAEFFQSGQPINNDTDPVILNTLIRRCESIWNPVYRGVSILTLLPSKNFERALLDQSLEANELDEPLIQAPPEYQLPGYFDMFEEMWAPRFAPVDLGIGSDDEDPRGKLIADLPRKFSYEPDPPYLYRRKVHNIMDDRELSSDSDQILEDDQLIVDDFLNEVAVPTHKFSPRRNFIEESRAKDKSVHDLIAKIQAERLAQQQMTPEPHTSRQPESVRRSEYTMDPVLLQILKDVVRSTGIDERTLMAVMHPYFVNGAIIREVEDCPYHKKIVQAVLRKLTHYLDQPCSSTDDRSELHRISGLLERGRICARLQSCPQKSSSKRKQTATHASSQNDAENARTRAIIRKFLEKKSAENEKKEEEEMAKATENVSPNRSGQGAGKLKKSVSWAED